AEVPRRRHQLRRQPQPGRAVRLRRPARPRTVARRAAGEHAEPDLLPAAGGVAAHGPGGEVSGLSPRPARVTLLRANPSEVRRTVFRVRILVLIMLLAASPVRADEPLSPRERGDLAIGARAILRKYCAECHGADAKAKQGTVNVLKHAQLVAKGMNPV